MRVATDALLPFGHASLCERAAKNSRPWHPAYLARSAPAEMRLFQADVSYLELRKASELAWLTFTSSPDLLVKRQWRTQPSGLSSLSNGFPCAMFTPLGP